MQEENAYGQLDPFENLPTPDTEATVKVVTRSRTKPIVDVAEEEEKDCGVITPLLSHKEAEAPVIEHKEDAVKGKERPFFKAKRDCEGWDKETWVLEQSGDEYCCEVRRFAQT